jgi:hypothetical protein
VPDLLVAALLYLLVHAVALEVGGGHVAVSFAREAFHLYGVVEILDAAQVHLVLAEGLAQMLRHSYTIDRLLCLLTMLAQVPTEGAKGIKGRPEQVGMAEEAKGEQLWIGDCWRRDEGGGAP